MIAKGTAAGSGRLLRLAALAGLVGPALFAGVVTGLTLAQYDFMRGLGWDPLHAPTFDWPSGLALGPYGALMTATFAIGGLMMAAFGIGLGQAVEGGGPARLGSYCVVLAGMALMGLSFTTDPTLRSTPATWHGRLHDLSFVALGLTLLPGMALLGFGFRNDLRWTDLSPLTWIVAALLIPTFVLKGIAFYIFLLAVLGWSEVAAFRLKSLAGTPLADP